MIKKIRIRGFKKFAEQEFDIPRHLVLVGPNNSGKTSLLQAVGAWTEIALRWSRQNPDLVRESDGNYAATNITVDSFGSVPLADFDHLWADKKTGEPLVVWLDTDRWKIGFECLHKAMELIAVRPARDVKESDLDALKDELDDSREPPKRSWRPVYIPPVSGVEVKESRFAEEATVRSYLAGVDAGKVLRNLLWQVRENGKWDELNKAVEDFFGYDLLPLSGGAFILAQYRHAPEEPAYDLSSAASGFLQVLLIYAAILGQRSTVYLMDEPDAHLHISLQNMLFRDLTRRAQRDKFQVIVATHSERLIREAEVSSLRLLGANGGLLEIPNRAEVLDSLALDQVQIVEALRVKRRLLYLEGRTDIEILRAWAKVLGHRCLLFLRRVTPIETAQRKLRKERATEYFSTAHFPAMCTLIPEARGVELLDRDQRNGGEEPPRGLKRSFWERKEIESYLLHPDSVVRYLQSKTSQANASKVREYMERNLPPAFFDDPCGEQLFLKEFPIKDFLSALFQEAGLQQATSKDFSPMAEGMEEEEIPQEVREKLDWIADCLELQEGSIGEAEIQ